MAITSISDAYDLIIMNDEGMTIRISSSEVNVQGRNTQGLRLMRSEAQVADLARILHTETAENEVPSMDVDSESLTQ